jgi:hypothetical protein
LPLPTLGELTQAFQACSALFRLCKQRAIWLQAARTMCYNHGLFIPSFPLETMSLKELIRLALSPFNFSRLLSTQSEGRLQEVQTRTFKARLHRSGQCLKPRALHLLPGGRYLLTYHNHDICLWDLGHGRVPPTHFPIASLHIENIRGFYGETPPCPIEGGRGVRLMVLSSCVSIALRREQCS